MRKKSVKKISAIACVIITLSLGLQEVCGGDIAGRGDGIVAECSIRLFGKYTAVCAGIQPDAESSGSGCEHIAAWLHLWLGVVVLLCAKLTKFRYSRMACIKNRDCKCIGRTFA